VYNVRDELHIVRRGLGPITIKFGKVIICFEIGGANVNKEPARRAPIFFTNTNHHFCPNKTKYKYSFKKYHDIINDDYS
jgi:hypothetical protein